MKKIFQLVSIAGFSIVLFFCKKDFSEDKPTNNSISTKAKGNSAGMMTLDQTFFYTEVSTIPPCTTEPFTCPFPIWTSYRKFNIPALEGVNKPTIKVSAHVSNINTNWIQLNQTSSITGLSFYPGAGAFARSGANISTAIGAMSASNVSLTFTVHITATWKAGN